MTVAAWGSAFVGIRAADRYLAPGALALGRLLVSTAILSVAALARRGPLPARRDLLAIAVYGIAWLGVYSVTLNAAERLVDAGTAAMIINSGPLLIALLAGAFLREGFPARLLTGCAVALAGCLVIGAATIHGARSGVGIALCVLAALAYAAAVVVQKPVLARVSPFQVTWLGCVAATIACLPFAPALGGDVRTASAAAIGWTIYLGAVPTALASPPGRRVAPGERGPDGGTELPDPRGRHRARLVSARRASAGPRAGRGSVVPARGVPGPAPGRHRASLTGDEGHRERLVLGDGEHGREAGTAGHGLLWRGQAVTNGSLG